MLFRCDDHTDSWPVSRSDDYEYVALIEPVGYPETAAVCGREDCTEPALVVLDDREYWRYQYRDERVFGLRNRADAAVRATDTVERERSDLVRLERQEPSGDENWLNRPKSKSAADY